ncbi:MAG: hypothetical protein QG573_2032 [Acidobacteriota bacterium]|nr:hypothetical protein [Acidobacteriota bacterium]
MSAGRRGGACACGLLLGLLLIAVAPLAALDPDRRLTQYRVETWGVEEGLPSLSVAVVTQTPDGYLWIGTTEGLASFDGVRFRTYDRWNTPAFRLNEIRSLFVDSRGALWIGFAGSGVVVRERDEFVAVEPSDLTAVNFAEDADGVLLGTDRGLFHRRHDAPLRFAPVPAAATLAGDLIFRVTHDRRGRTWLNVLKRGVFWLDGGELRGPLSFGSPSGLGDEYSTSLLDEQGQPVFSGSNGLFGLAGEEVRPFAPPRAKAEDPLYAQLIDRTGVLWFTGMLRAESQRRWRGVEESFPAGHRIADGRFSPMFEDREGNLWFGSWTQGLARLSDGPLASFSMAEGLSSDAARTLLEDASGAIWVGTTNGLNRIADGRIDSFRRPRTLADARDLNWVYALAEDGAGGLWLGSRAGLARFRQGRFTPPPRDGTQLSQPIFSLLRTPDGGFWVGATAEGSKAGGPLLRLEAGRWVEQALRADIVFSLLADSRGSIWAATKNGLFEILSDGRTVKHETPVEPLHQLFMSAAEDSRGDLWFGTLEGGLVRYRGGEFRLLRRQDGLFDDTAWAIVDDGLGYLWVSCARGLARMALRDLDAYLDGSAAKVRYRLFGTEDGLASSTFEGGNGNAGIRARDGRLWFATMKGAAVVDPRAIEALPLPPAIIEAVRVDGRSVAFDAPIALAPGNYRLEIDFTAIHLRAPHRLQFRYRLEGVDRDWIDAGARRLAEYPAVPAGSHRFDVLASLDGENWGLAATLPVAIAVPFWMRPWFFGLVALALVALGFGAQRARVGQLRRRAGELEGMVDFSRSVAGVLEPEEIGRQLERALVTRWGDAPRLIFAAREGRAAQRVTARLEAELELEPQSTAELFADWRRPLRLAETMMDAENAAGPLGALYRAGLLLAAPLVSGETAFGLLAVGGERARLAREADLAQLSALAAQAAMALEGAWQAQEATRWRHVSEARGEWLQLDQMARLVFATVARHGYAGAVTDSEVRQALGSVFTLSPGTTARIDAAIARLVSERILSRGAPSSDASTELRVERDQWLLLPEIRLPLAEIVRQSAQKIGAYQLVERIGAGGMGEVYRAVNVHDGTPAAVKILFPEQTADPTARKRLEGEGEIVAAISHPNIVRLLERGEHGGRLYLAMELLPGDTLAQRLTRGKLSERRALQMGAQIASALAALHGHGVIHRDVTSGNIMCLPAGRFVLLDFGLARGAARTTLTEAATMVGTLPYMAPEILRSESVDEASDLWSLGVVLFEALVGHLPWGEGQPTLQMALAIARLDTSPEVLTRAPLRTGVAGLLAELLHPDTRKRLRDAAEVAERLAGLALDANAASGEVALHIG